MPHCWVKLHGGEILDLRLRMWLGDLDDIPHGVIGTEGQTRFDYHGRCIEGAPLSWAVLSSMTDGLIDQVRLPQRPVMECWHGS